MNETHSKKQKDLLKSIKVRTEKDLITEFSSIYQALENINNDWDKRLEALKKIQALLLLPDLRLTDTFLNQYLKIIPCLNAQIKDLRSAITKEACQVICLSAENLQQNFETIALKFISRESLLSVINSGNKIIAENGHKCILSIIENAPSEKYVQVVLDELNSKNKDVRHKVSNYLLTMIQIFEKPLLEKNIFLFENALHKGLNDASQEVRNNSKEAFCVFNEFFPHNAERLFSNFDIQTKKAVTESLENYEQTGTISKSQVQANIGSPNNSAVSRPASFVQSSSSSSSNNGQGNVNNCCESPKITPASKKKRNSSFNERDKETQSQSQKQQQQQQQQVDLVLKQKCTPQKQVLATAQQQQQMQQIQQPPVSIINQSQAFQRKPPKTSDSQSLLISQKILDTKQLALSNVSPLLKESKTSGSIKHQQQVQQQQYSDDQNSDLDSGRDHLQQQRTPHQRQQVFASVDQKKRKSQTMTCIESISTKSPICKQQSNPGKQQQDNNPRINSIEKQNRNGEAPPSQSMMIRSGNWNSNNSNSQNSINCGQVPAINNNKKTVAVIQIPKEQQQFIKKAKKEQLFNSDDEYQGEENAPSEDNNRSNNNSNASDCMLNNNTNKSGQSQQVQKTTSNSSQHQQQQQQPPTTTTTVTTTSWRDDDIQFLLEKVKNNNWATRASAFEKISEMIVELSQQESEQEGEELSPQIIQKIIETHIEHLQDSHFKVVSTCLDSFIPLLRFKRDMIPPYMNKIIPKLLINLTDSKDKVAQQANFLLNLMQKFYKSDEMIPPTVKFLEGLTKQNLKVSTLEVLILIIKESTYFFNTINNVKNLVQLVARLTVEHYNNKQIILPCLGILLSLKDKNAQSTLHSILTLPNQNEVSSIRLLALQHVPELEDQIRSFAMNPSAVGSASSNGSNGGQTNLLKENIKPISKEGSGPTTTATATAQSPGLKSQQQKREVFQSLQQPVSRQQQQSQQRRNQDYNNEQASEKAIGVENSHQVSNLIEQFEDNQEFITQHINEIITNLIINFQKQSKDQQEKTQQAIYKIFQQISIINTIEPEIIQLCLDLYHNALKDQNLIIVDEIVDEMIKKVPHLTFMKALVDRMGKEKPPLLQIIIKRIQQIIQVARKEEIRPFLDHMIDNFKQAINDQSPDVRKSVVFCVVDLHFLFKPEIDSYLQLFTPTQQKLIDVYIKRKQEDIASEQQ